MLDGLPDDAAVIALGVPDVGTVTRLAQPLRAIAGWRASSYDDIVVEEAAPRRRHLRRHRRRHRPGLPGRPRSPARRRPLPPERRRVRGVDRRDRARRRATAAGRLTPPGYGARWRRRRGARTEAQHGRSGRDASRATPGRIIAEAAVGFERGADDYERARPSYPAEAVDLIVEVGAVWARAAGCCDLAAGTGKLTRLLVAVGRRRRGGRAGGGDARAAHPCRARRRGARRHRRGHPARRRLGRRAHRGPGLPLVRHRPRPARDPPRAPARAAPGPDLERPRRDGRLGEAVHRAASWPAAAGARTRPTTSSSRARP